MTINCYWITRTLHRYEKKMLADKKPVINCKYTKQKIQQKKIHKNFITLDAIFH